MQFRRLHLTVQQLLVEPALQLVALQIQAEPQTAAQQASMERLVLQTRAMQHTAAQLAVRPRAALTRMPPPATA